eukprot:gene5028-13434_t
MMQKYGWDGLGPGQEGRVQPVPTVLKRGRTGVGLEAAAVDAAGAAGRAAPRNWDAPYADRGDAGPGGVQKTASSAAAKAASAAHEAAAAAAPRVTHFKANDVAAVATAAKRKDKAIRAMLSDYEYPAPDT